MPVPEIHEPAALAVFCSEPGIRSAVESWLAGEYGSEVVERVSVPGGSWWLARAGAAHSTKIGRWVTARVAGGMEDALQAVLGRSSVRAIELVGHEGCEWYARIGGDGSAGDLVRLQGEDLLSGAREAARWSRSPVRAHFLMRAEGGRYTARPLQE